MPFMECHPWRLQNIIQTFTPGSHSLFSFVRCAVPFRGAVILHNRFGQIYMDIFNPVFVQRLDYEADMIFGCDGVSDFRETVQVLDDKSAQGIVVLGLQ